MILSTPHETTLKRGCNRLLNIIVPIKVVVDPEAPVSTFRIEPETQRASWGKGVPPVLNPYDENALEAALRIKELHPSKITVVSLGEDVPKAVIRKSMPFAELTSLPFYREGALDEGNYPSYEGTTWLG